MFTPAPLREAQRDRASSIAKKRGDGLERQPPVGTAADRGRQGRETAYCHLSKSAGTAWNADLRSAQRPAGPRAVHCRSPSRGAEQMLCNDYSVTFATISTTDSQMTPAGGFPFGGSGFRKSQRASTNAGRECRPFRIRATQSPASRPPPRSSPRFPDRARSPWERTRASSTGPTSARRGPWRVAPRPSPPGSGPPG